MKTLREYIDLIEATEKDVSGGQLDEISRRDFLKGLGAAGAAAALGAVSTNAKAQGKVKIAVEVGKLDTNTKEYDPVTGSQSRNFIYLYNSSEFVIQWIDQRGNNVGDQEVFQARGSGSDFKNRPYTIFISTKNAVKVVPNGAPEGDMIYFTPRNWIEQKIGWKSVYYQMFSKVKEDTDQGVEEAATPEAIERVEQIASK